MTRTLALAANTRCGLCSADDRDGNNKADRGAVDADSSADREAGERLPLQCDRPQDTAWQGERCVSGYAGNGARHGLQSGAAA